MQIYKIAKLALENVLFTPFVYLATKYSRLPVTHDVMQIACFGNTSLEVRVRVPRLSKRFGQMGETCCVHIVYMRGSFEGEGSLQTNYAMVSEIKNI